MKHRILHKVYEVFEKWSNEQADLTLVCEKGCSSCCTQNVTITALEGEDILRYIMAEKLTDWFSVKLTQNRNHQRPKMTTNDFAKACLDGRDVDPESPSSESGCPFLENNSCTIYPVRPFSCKLFVSSKKCGLGQPALIPDYYLEASTATTQLVEHLGQKEYWGNMLDVLLALLDISEFREISEKFNNSVIMQARMQTLTAKPLPGFLLSEEEGARVAPLIEAIFATEVDGKCVEDILNGK